MKNLQKTKNRSFCLSMTPTSRWGLVDQAKTRKVTTHNTEKPTPGCFFSPATLAMGGSSKGETIPAGAVHCREEMGAEAPASFPSVGVDGEAEALPPPKAGVTCAFVLAKNKKPLMPCHPARAKELLRKGKAKVVRLYPFTIRLAQRNAGNTQRADGYNQRPCQCLPTLTDGGIFGTLR